MNEHGHQLACREVPSIFTAWSYWILEDSDTIRTFKWLLSFIMPRAKNDVNYKGIRLVSIRTQPGNVAQMRLRCPEAWFTVSCIPGYSESWAVLTGHFSLVQIKCSSFARLEFGKVIQTLIDPEKEGLVNTCHCALEGRARGLVSPRAERESGENHQKLSHANS